MKEEEKEEKKEKEKKEKEKKEEIKEEEKKEDEKKEEENKEKLSFKVFFNNPDLKGFYIAFFSILFFPTTTFFISRNIFKSLGFSKAKQDAFGMLCSVIIIWFILITFIIIYYLDDCKKVFGGENKIIKNKEIKEKKE